MDLTMKIFYLNRTEDESGISGTGRVAQGFVFDNGKVLAPISSAEMMITQITLNSKSLLFLSLIKAALVD